MLSNVGIVHFLEPRPHRGREFEAEEPAAALQHAVGFAQRGGNVRHVPDAERDRVGIERPIGEGQDLGVGLRPYETLDATLAGAAHADLQHRRVDIRDRHRRAATRKAEGDVAGAAGHVEDVLARAGLHPADEAVLPQAVHAARHGVVHQVVAAGDAGEHAADAGGLLDGRDFFVAEGDGIGHRQGL
jgi:hypothetical protein